MKVWFALERAAQIVNLMRIPVNELDHAQDKIVRGVERIENLVSTNREGLLARGAALYFDKAKFPCLRVFAFNIVAELLKLPVYGFEAEATLDIHNNLAGMRRDGESIDGAFDCGDGLPHDLREQSKRDNDKTPEYHRRQRGYLAFKFELLHSLLKTALKVVSSTPGFLRIETGVYFSGLFLKFEFLGAVIPVIDLFRQAVFHGGAGLFDPFETPAADLL